MAEVASAFVSLVPSARGFGAATEAQVGPQLKSSGSKVGAIFGSAIKAGAIGVTVAAGALLATALSKGFSRLEAIDEARAKLDGLGHSAGTVDKIMRNALNSVRGTAFGLGDAATVSASAVAAGIKPGRELTKTLKLVADAATIGGSSLGEMGAIFNKVAASNKIQGDVINQLNDQGIPIIQLLGKQLGVTSAEVTDLASKGKIDFATFSAAMQQGLGGAALKSGNTFSGSLANVGASLSRIGAGLLGGIFPHLAPMFQGITKALEPLEGKATQVGDAIGRALGPALENVGPFLTRFTTALANLNFSKLGQGDGTLSHLGESLKKLGGAFKEIDFGLLAKALGEGAADTISVFSVVIGFAADHVDLLAKALPALVVAFAAYKTAQAAANVLALAHVPLTTAQIASNYALAAANRSLATQMAVTNGVERVGMIARARATVATVASTVATLAAGAASKVFAAGQWLVNAALSANPIGLVVIAIAALVAGLIYAYRNSETFRNVIDGVFSFLKTVVATTIDFVTAHWQLIVSIIGGPLVAIGILVIKHWGAIKDFVTSAVSAVINFVRDHWRTIITIIGGPLGLAVALVTKYWSQIKAATTAVWNAVKSVISAQINAAKSVVSVAISAIRGYFNLIGAIVDKVRGWFGDIVSAIKNKLGEAVSAVKAFPGKAVSALGDLSDKLINAGEQLIAGFIQGIANKFDDVQGKLGELTGKLTSWKGPPKKDKTLLTHAGEIIIQGLIDGLVNGEPGVMKNLQGLTTAIEKGVVDGLTSMRDKTRGILDGLKSDFASLRDSVASAFAPDVFSAPDRFAFMGRLGEAAGNLTALRGALRKLRSWHIDPGFLSQLFASGNSALILDLASGTRGEARSSAQMFGAVDNLTQQLGRGVARNEIGPKIDRTNDRLERIEKALKSLPKDFGREINGAATAGHKGRTA